MKNFRWIWGHLLLLTLGISVLVGCGKEPEPVVEVTPVAHADAVTVREGKEVAITLTGEAEPDASLTFTIVAPPAHGRLMGTAPALTYVPDENFLGRDAFTFTVRAGARTSAEATVEVEVLNAPFYLITHGSETNESRLYLTNERGEVSLKGTTGHALTSLKVDPTDGVIYAVTRQSDFNDNCNSCLVTLDPETGAGTVVGPLGNPTQFQEVVAGLAFTSNGSLFGLTASGKVLAIEKLNGAVVELDETDVQLWAFGVWADTEDTLWLINRDGEIYTIDTEDGTFTLIHDGEVLRESAGVASGFSVRGDRNPDTGMYWGVSANWGASAGVIRLHLDADTAEYQGVVRVQSVLGMHNLAFVR